MSFTARRMSLTYDGCAPPGQLVYAGADVARLRDVVAVVERARRIACAIIRDARETARRLDVRAKQVRRARQRDADVALTARASALETLYLRAQGSLIAHLETTLDEVLAAALTRIGAAIPAQQRLQIVCEQLRCAAGSAQAARLHLSETDAARYRLLAHSDSARSPWPAEIDDRLTAGRCRLTIEDGDWELDFDALIASLADAASTASPVNAADSGG